MSATVTSAERSQYREFVENQIQLLAKPPPSILWHYTTGDALIKIIQTGSLFSTQISCANDTTEFSYSRDNIIAAFKRKRSTIRSQDAFSLLDYIDSYSFPDTSTNGSSRASRRTAMILASGVHMGVRKTAIP